MSWTLTTAPGAGVRLGPDGLPAGEVRALLEDRPTRQVLEFELAGGTRGLCRRTRQRDLSRVVRELPRFAGAGPAVREARNLNRLAEAGVPAVTPLAWATRRDRLGLVRDGWVLLPLPEGARRLEEMLLAGEAVEESVWMRIGASVRRMHRAGCFHGGLTARALLVEPGLNGAWRVRWTSAADSRWSRRPIPDAWAVYDLLLLILPWAADVRVVPWLRLLEGYGRWAGQSSFHLQEAMPRRLRKRLQRAVERQLSEGPARTRQPEWLDFDEPVQATG